MAQAQQPKRPIPAIEPFRATEGDTTDFRDWLVKFQVYLRMIEGPIAAGQQGMEDITKMQYLTMNLGTQALRSFSKTPTYARMDVDAALTYDEFLEAAKRHFSPPMTKTKARYDFARRQQHATESIDEYMTVLRTMALDCQFGDDARINEELLYRLVQGINDAKTQQELLAMEDLTLERGLAIVKANEAARSASSGMRPATMEVKQVGWGSTRARGRGGGPRGRGASTRGGFRPQQQLTRGCMGCGSETHKFGDAKCPALNLECRWCKKQGHMEKVCVAKKKGVRGRGTATTRAPTVRVMDADIIKQIHGGSGTETAEFTATFHLANGRQQWTPLRMEVDSGAQPSVIPYKWYRENLAAVPLKKHTTGLRNYDGTNMTGVKGTITTKVNFGGRCQKLKFYIRDGPHKPIAGRNLLCAMGVTITASPTGVEIKAICKDNILEEFPDLLSEKLGTFPGQEHIIRIRGDAVPRVTTVRPVPVARQEAVNEEIRAMDDAGIWQETTASEWAHPLVTVPKTTGGVRITTDLTGLNPYVIPERYPLPKIKDLFLKFTGATVFSKLDLRKGYYHIPLAEESKKLTTTITPLGLRNYNRLPMGLTDAASAFQRRIHQTLQGLPGVVVYIDDIIVFGRSQEEHDRHLRAVLSRLNENDFRLQTKKCILGASEIPAFGHIISKTGIQPDPKNLQPILEAPAPTTVKELQSFLGLVNYYNDFLPNIATDAEPMRRLTRKDETFQWTADCQQSFEAVKEKIAKATRLVLFDPEALTYVTTDASDYGIGAVLTQIQDGQERPVAYFNKTLDSSERNYAANEKEALAVLRSCEHWENLLLGRHFTIRTDHRALTTLLRCPKNMRQSAKFQRWQQRLAEFDYDIEHIAGETNRIADYLSRVKMAAERPLTVSGIQLQQLQTATKADSTLQKIQQYMETKWPKHPEADINRYVKITGQLRWEDGLLWKEGRIVVPQSERTQILKEVHTGHPGIERMKRILRMTYWWPDMDTAVLEVVRQCHGCQMSQKTRTSTGIPTTQIPAPKESGRQYAIDITGPYNGRFLTVLIDYHSRFPELLDSSVTTSETLIKWLTEIFDRSGNPDALVSDNRPQFVSQEFEDFLKNRDIHHYRTAVYNPQENGLVESFNRYLKYGIQAFQAEGRPWAKGLRELVTSYRAIPTEEGRSPAELYYGRTIRYGMTPNRTKPLRRTAQQQKGMVKGQESEGTREEAYSGPSLYKRGQVVVTKLPQVGKGKPPYSNTKRIQRVLGYWTYLLSDGQVWHARKIKAYKAWTPHHEDEVTMEPQQQRLQQARDIHPYRRPPLYDGLTTFFQPQHQQRRRKPAKRYDPQTGR